MSLLRSKGARVDCDGLTPLMMSSQYGRLEAAKWLVDHGANVAATASLLFSPQAEAPLPQSAMLRAASEGHLEMLRYLHAQGASFVAEAGGEVNTALHEAAMTGHGDCVRFILACGLAVDSKKSGDLTACTWLQSLINGQSLRNYSRQVQTLRRRKALEAHR